jgi:hypothetical protein
MVPDPIFLFELKQLWIVMKQKLCRCFPPTENYIYPEPVFNCNNENLQCRFFVNRLKELGITIIFYQLKYKQVTPPPKFSKCQCICPQILQHWWRWHFHTFSRDGILEHRLNKDSSLLLHAIHSPFYWPILKKIRLFSGFKNRYKKNPRNKKTQVYLWIAFCRGEKWV